MLLRYWSPIVFTSSIFWSQALTLVFILNTNVKLYSLNTHYLEPIIKEVVDVLSHNQTCNRTRQTIGMEVVDDAGVLIDTAILDYDRMLDRLEANWARVGDR